MSIKALFGYVVVVGLILFGLCFVCNTILKDNPCTTALQKFHDNPPAAGGLNKLLKELKK